MLLTIATVAGAALRHRVSDEDVCVVRLGVSAPATLIRSMLNAATIHSRMLRAVIFDFDGLILDKVMTSARRGRVKSLKVTLLWSVVGRSSYSREIS